MDLKLNGKSFLTLRILAVSVYTVGVDSTSFPAENDDPRMLFTLSTVIAWFQNLFVNNRAPGTFLTALD